MHFPLLKQGGTYNGRDHNHHQHGGQPRWRRSTDHSAACHPDCRAAPASGEGEGTKKGGDPAPKEGEGTKPEAKDGKSYSEADVEAKIAEAKAAWEAEQQEKQRLAKLSPEERAKEQELTKLRAELLQRDLKDAALKKLTDEGFPGGLADLLTYTDQESMEKSLKHTQEVFKGALEVAVKERLRGKTPEGLGGGAKVENTVKDQIAQSIRGGMM